MVIWVAAILMIVGIALFIAAPLADHRSGSTSIAAGAEPAGHGREHALAVQALRELEFDRAMGKLDSDDYRDLRQRLEIRALATMGATKRTPNSPDSTSAAVPSLQSFAETRIASVNFCVACGARFEPAHDLCPNCGAGRVLATLVDS